MNLLSGVIHLRCALVAALLLLVACSDQKEAAVPVNSGDEISLQWRMVTTWPPGFPIFQEAAEKFAGDVAIMSRNRLQIQVFAGGELVPALEVFDAVSQGVVEMGHGASYYWAGKVPAAQFFSTMPFGMNASDMAAWLYFGGGLELWRQVYKPFNVIPFPMGNTGAQMGGWFNSPIHSLDDVRGLRMRIPGLGGKVLAAAGGNPVLTSGGELYTALERGVIDATEWVGPFHDTRLGLQRAARYYHYPGWHEPGTEFELIVSEDAWNSLPEDLQKVIEVAAMATGRWLFSSIQKHNSEALAELKRQGNVELVAFPPEVLRQLAQLSHQVLEAEGDNDESFERVRVSYQQFLSGMKDWRSVTSDAMREALSDSPSEAGTPSSETAR